MSVMFIVLPLAIAFAALAVGVFFWAVRTGQFDDLTTPSLRLLVDDERRKGEEDAAASRATAPVTRRDAPSSRGRTSSGCP